MKEKDLDIFTNITNEIVKNQGFLLVEIKADNNYNFKVYIDKSQGNITIDDCVKVSRRIEHEIEEIFDNFSLEVSSPGLTSPFKIKEQYIKNKGKEIEVLQNNGVKDKGILEDVIENKIILAIKNKKETTTKEINFDLIKKAKLVLKF